MRLDRWLLQIHNTTVHQQSLRLTGNIVLNSSMEGYCGYPGEGLLSEAIRRRNSSPENPGHLSREEYHQFMKVGIAAVEARMKLIQEALAKAGKLDARI